MKETDPTPPNRDVTCIDHDDTEASPRAGAPLLLAGSRACSSPLMRDLDDLVTNFNRSVCLACVVFGRAQDGVMRFFIFFVSRLPQIRILLREAPPSVRTGPAWCARAIRKILSDARHDWMWTAARNETPLRRSRAARGTQTGSTESCARCVIQSTARARPGRAACRAEGAVGVQRVRWAVKRVRRAVKTVWRAAKRMWRAAKRMWRAAKRVWLATRSGGRA